MPCDYFSFDSARRGANINSFYAKRIFRCFLFLCIYDVVLYDVYISSYKATKKRKGHLECKYHKCCCFDNFYVYEKSPITLCLGDFIYEECINVSNLKRNSLSNCFIRLDNLYKERQGLITKSLLKYL